MCLSGNETVYRTDDMQLNAFPIFILLLLCLVCSTLFDYLGKIAKFVLRFHKVFILNPELADKHSPTEVLFRVMLKAIEKLKACKISPIESAADSVVMVIAERIGK